MYSKFFDIKDVSARNPVFPKTSISPKKGKSHSSSQTLSRKQNHYANYSKEYNRLRTPTSKLNQNFSSSRNLYKKPSEYFKKINSTKAKPQFSKELKMKLNSLSHRELHPIKKSTKPANPFNKNTKKRGITDKNRGVKAFESSRKSTGLKYYKTKVCNDSYTNTYETAKKKSTAGLTTKTSSQNFLKSKQKINPELELKAAKAFFKTVKKNNIIAINTFYQNFKKMSSQRKKNFAFDLTDDEGCYLSHYAVWHNNIQLFQFLLKNKVSFDVQNKDQITPLMLGALKGHTKLAALLTNITTNINEQDKAGNTALHYAVVRERLEVVKVLMKNRDIDTDIRNKDGNTAIDLAHPRICVKLQEILMKQKDNLHIGKREIEVYGGDDKSLSRHAESEKNFKKPAKHHIFSTNIENDPVNDNKAIGLNHFIIHSKIGEGSFGEVFLVEKKDTNTFAAMKVLSKEKILSDNLKRYALTERNVLSTTDHPFIVKLRYAFQNSENLFLLMDYCPGGDLGEYLEEEGRFSEKRTKIYIAEVILALDELHKNNIIFRDLKPENIILDAKGHAMLIDFGLSKEGVYAQNRGAKSFCGSVAYLAPEMVKKIGHGKSMDWYLLGVVMYEFLVGIPPFYADTKEELFHNIEHGKLKIPNFISQPAKDLLIGLLQRSPHKRLGYNKGAEEIKAHPWFFDIDWNRVMQRKLIPPKPVIKKVKLFHLNPQPRFESRANERLDSVNGWTFIEPAEPENEQGN